jgi:MoaA/NifB/PqqE/SkfB family radical SAM enzyme
MRPSRGAPNFHQSPLLVFYETTRACDLACRHCRANAEPDCHPDELSTAAALRVLRDVASFPTPPLLVLTGGDPLKRRDVFELIRFARDSGLRVAMTPSATPLVTRDVILQLEEAGLHRLAISLDGADAATHDAFRQVRGSFARTLQIAHDAINAGLPVQINTTVGRHNVHQLRSIGDLLGSMRIALWSVFFIVPTGRATARQRLNAEQIEAVFAELHAQSAFRPFPIKTTEAPHYRRFAIQRAKSDGARMPDPSAPGMSGTNDGNGIVFISHTGEIYPSGFLPICCGQAPIDSVVRVYQDAALFRALRDPTRLGGKCGECEFRNICGGSRARAFALAGDPLAEEPDCAYLPARWPKERLPC